MRCKSPLFSSPIQDYAGGIKLDLSLDRIQRCLKATRNPHLSLPPTLHVAGTNGKCSTITFMRSILEQAGYKVHQFTSPHLVKVNERILLAGQEITDGELNELFQILEPFAKDFKLSWFEFLTLTAIKAFSEVPSDILLLETGLGGEFDATNVLPSPLASIITPISYDHMDYLGSTLSEIAKAKAGIIKPLVPVFCAAQKSEVTPVLIQKSRELESPLYMENKDWNISYMTDYWELHIKDEILRLLYPERLKGLHQIQNAALAISTLKLLNCLPISDENIREGARLAYCPGRLMQLPESAVKPFLPPDSEIWFDGGHNPSAATVLSDFFKNREGKPLYCIVGMLNTKSPNAFLKALKPITSCCVFIPVSENQLSFTPDQLTLFDAEALRAYSVKTAIERIKEHSHGRPVTVLICGSFYLAKEVLSLG